MPDAIDARIGCTPCAYSPLFFASQVLPDGKVVIVGGEDLGSTPGQVETNIGFFVRPGDQHLVVAAGLGVRQRNGRRHDVDGSSNGTMIVSQITSGNIEAFNEATLSFTALNPPGKADINNEEGWSILPNGKILTVDAFIQAQSEFYDPVANTWGAPLNTVVNMADTGNLGGDRRGRPGDPQAGRPADFLLGQFPGTERLLQHLDQYLVTPRGDRLSAGARPDLPLRREGRHVRHASERKCDRDGRADRQRKQRLFGGESLLGAGLRDQHAESGRRFTERGRVRRLHGALHDAPKR